MNGVFTAAVVDAEPDGDPPWLATAYVPGMSLSDAVSAYGPWAQDSVLALGAGLAEALVAIHAAGVVHRDLNPGNVLLSADGPRVIDFGISVGTADTTGADRVTKTGAIIGTPGFVAPEQVTGDPVGPGSDVFSLGALLAWTATGRGLFGDAWRPSRPARGPRTLASGAGRPRRAEDDGGDGPGAHGPGPGTGTGTGTEDGARSGAGAGRHSRRRAGTHQR